MNYKELQQIAKEVGAVIDVLMLGRHDNTVFTTGELERFATIIERKTIDRCAAICENIDSLASSNPPMLCAATRRAIVRAAAEIGKEMK